MRLKLSQVLNAYCCDTALTEMTGKTAEKYLLDHNIVDTEVERINEQLLVRNVREQRIRYLCIEFFTKGMEKVVNSITNKEEIPGFEVLYDHYKPEIEKLL